MVCDSDRAILRDLAKQYMDLCEGERNRELIAEWRKLNNMEPCRPMIYANDGMLSGEIQPSMPEPIVEDEALHNAERRLRRMLLWDAKVGDDRVFYPWFGMHAEMFRLPEGAWGVVSPEYERNHLAGGTLSNAFGDFTRTR